MNKFTTQICVCYPEVYNFALKHFGSKNEGLNRASFLKNGQYQDQYMLGATRQEFKAFLGD